jgi:hypothetical protein
MNADKSDEGDKDIGVKIIYLVLCFQYVWFVFIGVNRRSSAVPNTQRTKHLLGTLRSLLHPIRHQYFPIAAAAHRRHQPGFFHVF